MKIEDNAQEKINMIQAYEQNLSALISQKQSFQSQLLEIESSLIEIQKTKKAYKIIGNIMVETDVPALKKDTKQRQEMLKLRIDSIEKQEEKIKEKIADTQKEVMDTMKKK
ncbi:hypothetical protein GOV08_00285 [Candidatus Woesearchaeota archaeon]|nr:hypothetical protein [Candidatus Woesearchaeota archaeon]